MSTESLQQIRHLAKFGLLDKAEEQFYIVYEYVCGMTMDISPARLWKRCQK